MRIKMGLKLNELQKMFVLIFLCVVLFDDVLSFENPPIIRINTGYIKGHYKTSYNGRKYRAFEGIPYAMPPIGKLRFEPPMRMFPWHGVAFTNSFGSMCMQYNRFSLDPTESYTVVGAEDCLYINVFTPERNKTNDLLPVLFFIHGGEFTYSDSHLYSPKFLMDREVIVVTFNYRLGPLGFLSTEDDIVPGNMGLKDQGLALRWTYENAEAFGGDNSRITILGQGSGAASAQFHSESHWSNGYFQRGISASGTAHNSWALTKNPLERAKKLADIVGCTERTVITMVECLQHRPANQIVKTVGEFLPYKYSLYTPFGPVVEKGGRYPFIEREPIISFYERKNRDLPWIYGFVSNEAALPIAGLINNEKLLEEVDNEWNVLATLILNFNETIPKIKQNRVATKIKQHYFGNQNIDLSNANKFMQMVNDKLYFVNIEEAVRTHSEVNQKPIWLYQFSYQGAHSYSEVISNATNNMGPAHLDDIAYIFETPFIDMNSKTEDRMMREKLLDIFISFATTGKPDTSTNWEPVNRFASQISLLHIGGPKNIHMDHVSHLGETQFWTTIDANTRK